ncbi:hypothetical protein VP01_5209g1, partial [Puccinia sorghi]
RYYTSKSLKRLKHLSLRLELATSLPRRRDKKNRQGPYCAPGKHNSEATSHDAENCWQLHPELRPPQSFKGNSGHSQTPTTQLVEVEDGHESEVSLLFTEAASKPVVLDSRATHHLVNNPDVFLPSAKSNIKIATGGHSCRWNRCSCQSSRGMIHSQEHPVGPITQSIPHFYSSPLQA